MLGVCELKQAPKRQRQQGPEVHESGAVQNRIMVTNLSMLLLLACSSVTPRK
jgi:hypothetical protein